MSHKKSVTRCSDFLKLIFSKHIFSLEATATMRDSSRLSAEAGDDHSAQRGLQWRRQERGNRERRHYLKSTCKITLGKKEHGILTNIWACFYGFGLLAKDCHWIFYDLLWSANLTYRRAHALLLMGLSWNKLSICCKYIYDWMNFIAECVSGW